VESRKNVGNLVCAVLSRYTQAKKVKTKLKAFHDAYTLEMYLLYTPQDTRLGFETNTRRYILHVVLAYSHID
jgi:hypothetical protein